ncbi:MAG: hypothetical protein AAF184_14190 [Pseudomonadota bacterium]
METATLHIRRMSNALRVPGWPAIDAQTRMRLSSAMDQRALTTALGASLGVLLPEEDPGVVILRELELECDLDLACDSSRLAAHWADVFTKRLLARLSDAKGIGSDMVRFRDSVEQLACFCVDLSRGRAWDHWYHRCFEGLRALPASTALRTALLQDAARGEHALLRLQGEALGQVLRALTASAAWTLLAELGQRTDTARLDPEDWHVLQRTLAPSYPLADTPSGAHLALTRYLAARHQCPEVPASSAATWATASAALAIDVSPERRGADTGTSLARQLADDPADAIANLGAEWLQPLRPLLRAARGDRQALLRHVDPLASNTKNTLERAHTRFGGAFLLAPGLRILTCLGLDDQADHLGEDSPHAALRLLLLSLALGRSQADACFSDPVVRNLCGVGPKLTAAATVAWCRHSLALPIARDALPVSPSPPPDDTAWLSPPPALDPGSRVRDALLPLAYALWDPLSRRLGRLGRASLPWMYTNLMPPHATVTREDGAWDVALAPAPLQVMLNVSGITGEQHLLPWLDDTRMQLRSTPWNNA